MLPLLQPLEVDGQWPLLLSDLFRSSGPFATVKQVWAQCQFAFGEDWPCVFPVIGSLSQVQSLGERWREARGFLMWSFPLLRFRAAAKQESPMDFSQMPNWAQCCPWAGFSLQDLEGLDL